MPLITIKNCKNCQRPHEWLFEGATLKELRMIKKLTGMRANEFAEAGDTGDPEALAALLYVLHKREKITIPFEEVDLDFGDFDMVPTKEELEEADKAEKAEEAEEAEPAANPKKTNGRKGKAD